jgi:uncharacterized protein YqjF (DUF2071 family)
VEKVFASEENVNEDSRVKTPEKLAIEKIYPIDSREDAAIFNLRGWRLKAESERGERWCQGVGCRVGVIHHAAPMVSCQLLVRQGKSGGKAGYNPCVTATEDLRFTPELLTKPIPRGLAVETTLQHFVIVTYWVDPSRVRQLIHSRFEPVCLAVKGGPRRALISVVTFVDRDFRFAAFPYFKRSFGQTNYRAYVQDTETGEQAAWFFGTCLDSVSVAIPRYLWRLPWHRGRMEFDCRYDEAAARYSTFKVRTQSEWAPARLAVEDSGKPPVELAGVSNLEAGLVLLTHPMRGYFFRRDGALGSYRIWHNRTRPTVGTIQEASYPLLQRLGLVDDGDLKNIHSILLERTIEFTIYLPPSRVKGESPG